MSKLSRILDRLRSIPEALNAWAEVRDLIARNSPALYRVLDQMIADKHREAALALLSWGSVVDVVAYTLRMGEDAARVLLGAEVVVNGVTRALERVDAILNEEKIVALMELLRMPRGATA